MFYLKKNFEYNERFTILTKETEQLNSLLQTILLCGAATGSLTSDVLSYLSRKTASLKGEGIRYDINLKDATGATAMHYAAMYGKDEVIKLLYHFGAEESLLIQDYTEPHRTIVAKHENFNGYSK